MAKYALFDASATHFFSFQINGAGDKPIIGDWKR